MTKGRGNETFKSSQLICFEKGAAVEQIAELLQCSAQLTRVATEGEPLLGAISAHAEQRAALRKESPFPFTVTHFFTP